MKCYNCHHNYQEENNCTFCDFPTADTIALFKDQPLVSEDVSRFFEASRTETEIMKENLWYDRAISTIAGQARVVQLNF